MRDKRIGMIAGAASLATGIAMSALNKVAPRPAAAEPAPEPARVPKRRTELRQGSDHLHAGTYTTLRKAEKEGAYNPGPEEMEKIRQRHIHPRHKRPVQAKKGRR